MTETCSDSSGSMTLLGIHLISVSWDLLGLYSESHQAHFCWMQRSSIIWTWSSIWILIPISFDACTYVDDVIAAAASEDEAFDLYTRAKEILQRGGFNLRKFLTDSQQLQLRIDQAKKSHTQPKKIMENVHITWTRLMLKPLLAAILDKELGSKGYLECAGNQIVISSYLTWLKYLNSLGLWSLPKGMLWVL